MAPLTYNDVKGQLPRFWKMVETPDPRLGLVEGDLLVFEGNAPGTIKKIKPKTRGSLRSSPDAWGTGFKATSVNPYAIQGTLDADPTVEIEFIFTEVVGAAGPKLTLFARFPGGIQPISWTAEEGP